MLLHGGEPRRRSSRRQLVRGFRNLCRVLGAAALFMPPSEGQEPRALTVAAQAIEGRKCAETAKVHPDLRIVYNLAYGVLAGEAGRFSLVGDYTTKFKSPNQFRAFSRLPVGPVLAGLRGFASRASSLTFPCLWPPTASLFSVILYLPCERARGHFLYWCGFRSGQLWLATPE